MNALVGGSRALVVQMSTVHTMRGSKFQTMTGRAGRRFRGSETIWNSPMRMRARRLDSKRRRRLNVRRAFPQTRHLRRHNLLKSHRHRH